MTSTDMPDVIDLFIDGTSTDVTDWCREHVATPKDCHDFLANYSVAAAELVRYVTNTEHLPVEASWGFMSLAPRDGEASGDVAAMQMLIAALNGDFATLDAHVHATLDRDDVAYIAQVIGGVVCQVGRWGREARQKAMAKA